MVKQFVKFGIVGITNTAIDFVVYYMATRWLGVWLVTANIMSFLVAIGWSFYWNRRWTFRHTAIDVRGQYLRFFVVNATGLAWNTAILYGLTHWFHIFDLYAKVCAIALVMVWSFTLSKLWAFRRPVSSQTDQISV